MEKRKNKNKFFNYFSGIKDDYFYDLIKEACQFTFVFFFCQFLLLIFYVFLFRDLATWFIIFISQQTSFMWGYSHLTGIFNKMDKKIPKFKLFFWLNENKDK